MRRRNVKVVAALAALLIGSATWFQNHHDTAYSSAEPAADAGPEAAAAVGRLLSQLTVVDKLPDVPGYQRGCKKNQKCVFGPAWQDPDDHSGCDARARLVASQLKDLKFKPGTRNCKVVSGVLDPDPYSGRVINYTISEPSSIEADHIFALARAWDAGAAQWDLRQRKAFANDLSNLVMVDGRLNEAKGSAGLEWLPPNEGFRCTYVQRYLATAVKYKLLITRSDENIATATCRAT